MASTRLKNAPMSYKREMNTYNKSYNNNTYVGKILHNQNFSPGLGMNYPTIPNGINNSVLSQNGADIESSLFGIGSTNLVQPKAPVVAQLNNIGQMNFFDAKPESNDNIPEPLVIHNNERYTIFRR
tara:strand:- start:1160 stop:1537 length:378 start_codon:yes stop_codon:yes gene_type:complete